MSRNELLLALYNRRHHLSFTPSSRRLENRLAGQVLPPVGADAGICRPARATSRGWPAAGNASVGWEDQELAMS